MLDGNYQYIKNQVIKAERKLLRELGFCVHVKHPHKVNNSVSAKHIPGIYYLQKTSHKLCPVGAFCGHSFGAFSELEFV